MASRTKGIIIEIDGDATGLDEALKEVNSSIKTTQSQLKDVNKLLKLDPGNTELITQKQKMLGDAVESTKTKLDTLRKAAEQANDQLASGKINQTQYDALQREIVACEKELEKLEAQTREFGSVSAQSIAALGNKFKEVGDKITDIGKKVSIVSTAVAALGVACVKYASDAQEAANKVDVSFGDSADEVKAFADTTLESFGIARGTALDMAALFGDMGTSMGISQAAAAKMSTALVGLAGDLASFKNVSLETAQNALKGIFTGETESLKSLGIVMNDTTLKSYAMAEGFSKNYSQMSQSEKVMLRYQYVMESTKNAQGDFANTSDGTANSLRIFQESLKELGETLGNQILPIITPIIQHLTGLIQKISELPAPVQKVIVIIGMIVAAAGPLLIIIGTLMSSAGSIMTNAPIIAKVIKDVASVLGGGLKTALTSIGTVITSTVIPALSKLNASLLAFLANPTVLMIGAIIAILIALGVAIYAVVKNWDAISAAATSAAESIRSAWNNSHIGQTINQEFTTARDTVVNAANAMKDAFESSGGGIRGAIEATFAGVKTAIKTYMAESGGITVDELDGMINSFKSLGSRLLNTVTQNFRKIRDEIINSVEEAISSVIDGIKSLPGKISEALQNLLGKVMEPFDNIIKKAKTWGSDLVDNFAGGILGNNKATQAAADMAGGIHSYLGFSEPEKGDLADFHTYAPDMIDLWCKGVKDNMYKINEASIAMAKTMNPATRTEFTNNMTSSIDSLTSAVRSSLATSQSNAPTNVTVVLQGDANKLFRVVSQENSKQVRATGYHALA